MDQVDPDSFLADLGVSVKAGAISGIGLLDQASEMVLNGQVISVDYSVTCRTDVFGGLKTGALVVVDGRKYTLRHYPLKVDDGTFCLLALEKV